MPKIEGGMGFKELRKFNDAMLAKQVWRLVHDKESLFYRVFKASPYSTGFSRLSSSHRVIFFQLKSNLVPMLGEVSLRLDI